MTALWIDQPDASSRLAKLPLPNYAKEKIKDIMEMGLAVLEANVPPELCDQVIEDYQSYSNENSEYVKENLDQFGHEKRLVDFHHWSEAGMQLALNETALSILDIIFGKPACPYTSLTFKYGTQQPAHKDTPHFATFPLGFFAGVWTALEDINPDMGPLFYFPKSHRIEFNRHEFREKRGIKNFWHNDEKLNLEALSRYNAKTLEIAGGLGDPIEVLLKKGDTVIWHPELIHGGSRAINPESSRWSIVVHCASEEVQVHHHDRYFNFKGDDPPPDRYGFRKVGKRKCAVAGKTAFM